jgi:hypothetical protein
MWLIFVVGAPVIAYIWTLHSQRDSLREALGETIRPQIRLFFIHPALAPTASYLYAPAQNG